MRELILNWDKLNDDTQYSIIGLTEFMGIEKGIEFYTGLIAMQVLDDNSQGVLAVSYTHLTLPTNREV